MGRRARLRYGNRLINEKIYRLIEEFETEATDLMLQRIAATEALKRRSSRILGAIAIGAVLLVLLFVAILWRDIDRSNRYKRALERADREKAKLLEAREKLMLAITHDIKAPLGAIMGYIDLLSRIAPEKRQQHYLHNMRQSADHLHALTESLLDFLRLDTRKVESQRVLFRPATLFATIGEAFAPAARSKGLALHTSIADSARQEVAGDAFRIRQIADNLISNALKFTDAGEVRIGVAVERGTLLFSVRDTGGASTARSAPRCSASSRACARRRASKGSGSDSRSSTASSNCCTAASGSKAAPEQARASRSPFPWSAPMRRRPTRPTVRRAPPLRHPHRSRRCACWPLTTIPCSWR